MKLITKIMIIKIETKLWIWIKLVKLEFFFKRLFCNHRYIKKVSENRNIEIWWGETYFCEYCSKHWTINK